MSKRRVFLLLLGVVAFLLAGASMPHTHAGAGLGLWNADHDLSLMAAFGTHACQLDAMPVLGHARAARRGPRRRGTTRRAPGHDRSGRAAVSDGPGAAATALLALPATGLGSPPVRHRDRR